MIGLLFKNSGVILPLALVAIVISAFARAIPSIFMQKVISIVDKYWQNGSWQEASKEIIPLLYVIVATIIISLITTFFSSRAIAIIGQNFMKKMRVDMFSLMQRLPISYFDQNPHGDIMSRYTNDIDALRQFISSTLPQTITSLILIFAVFCIMIWYSIWMTLIVLLGLVLMFFITSKIGGNSAKYFKKQQASLGRAEGFAEEIMYGQKVVKVFNQEDKIMEKFNELNDQLYEDARRANSYANVLMPVMFNIGNLLYVAVAIVGSLLLLTGAKNFSISGMAFSISIIIPFLNMTKQFAGNLGMLSNQINSVAMAGAAADRIFHLLDQEEEVDEGRITLVRVIDRGMGLEEYDKYTGKWAWKEVLEDGTVKLTELKGDVRLEDVNFSYEEGKPILKNISLYAKPGQKVAFVGATGAGKTTITNLINRFYEIDSGKILYDGIDIRDIKKADLRRSMGLVLQDTNLFTGSVMENIRYGNLEADDGQCIAAAKLTGGHSFISKLSEGYESLIDGNNDSLSQGQKQLISIARAAVHDPPVMVLDEATSSIDTRTEKIVQDGMDQLMMNRTVFVIAHRLSTIRNSDVIMLLDKGEIIERGNHEELMALNGRYYDLYTGGFELD